MKLPRPLLLALTTLVAGSGCYTYVPSATPTPTQGTPVRVHLSRPSSFELLALTAHNIDRVDGEMIQRDRGQLFVSATWLGAVTGEGFNGGLWTVGVEESVIASRQVKTFSWWRTGIVIAGGAVATWLGFDALNGSAGAGGQGGGGGSTR